MTDTFDKLIKDLWKVIEEYVPVEKSQALYGEIKERLYLLKIKHNITFGEEDK